VSERDIASVEYGNGMIDQKIREIGEGVKTIFPYEE
jgi:hypothetical protein